jgi:muramoyltetrapeptide carboxypeptidase
MTHNQKIQPGDTIALITPSSPLFPGRLEGTINYFEERGFQVKVGKHNKKIDRFLAGSDQERAEDIMMFFSDPTVKAIVVTGGGAGSIRTLPFLDYDTIKSNPKPIIGFSDTTSLQLGMYAKTGLESFTGFTGKDVVESDFLDPLIADSLDNCLQHRNYVITEGKTVNPGKVTAPLVGGNLMALTSLLGTPYEPCFKNKILFFEEVWAEPYIIDRFISQLWLAGVFDQAAAVIIGRFANCTAKFNPKRDGTIDDLIDDWVKRIEVPCIKNFPYGHFDSRCVLPIGQKASLDAEACRLEIVFNESDTFITP